MKAIDRYINSESGSTSVLIVILMIVLMAFGMAALTTSYASYKMATRNSAFGDEYNQMENQAVQVEYDILQIIENISLQIKTDSEVLDKNTYNEYMSVYGSTAILDYLRTTEVELVGAAFEQDEIGTIIDSKMRIGTMRYTISMEGVRPKNLTVKLNVFAPPLLGYTSYKEFIEVVEWFEWQESPMNDMEIEFDDLFDEGN